MRRYVTQKTLRFRALLITLLTCILIVCYSAHIMLQKYADIVCHSSCAQYGEQLINRAVEMTLQRFDMSKLIIQDDISAISCYSGYSVDSSYINEIADCLLENINNDLYDELHSYVQVPIGAFTGISFLSGSGPNVKIDIYAVGSPEIELVRHFESAGINQSLFELYAEISVTFSAVMPAETVSVTVNRQVLLAQKVIIGDVPQFYYPSEE